MARIKMDKHEVYTLIAENLTWFPPRKSVVRGVELESMRYRTCLEIEAYINRLLKKNYDENRPDSKYDPPYIKLHGTTLTAMVNDGVLLRKKGLSDSCYSYCPVMPLNEDYCV